MAPHQAQHALGDWYWWALENVGDVREMVQLMAR
jgi:hypothetical protein